MSQLQYNIESRILKGKIGDYEIHGYAGAGGRSGSKVVRENLFLANNSFATHVGGASSKGTHNYGPIPRGTYTLRLYESEKRKNWIKLIPDATNQMYNRSGFAIHGRGEIGSHGCIVPQDFNVIKTLVKALKENSDGDFKLEVVSIGPDIGWQNRIA